MKMTDKIISLDCESNGLHGQIFAAAVSIQTRRHGEVCIDQYRTPIVGRVDPWVAEHVLPALDGETTGIPEQAGVETTLWRWWRDLYDPLKEEGYQVLVHVGWPVEARFLYFAHAADPFSGPFPLLDVSGHLDHAGFDPASMDDYLRARGIQRPPGSPHHPLYDARATAAAYWDLTRRRMACGD